MGGVREEKRRTKRKSQKKESRETLCFSNDLWLRGSKSRLAKAAGAEPAGQMRDEKLHAVVARSTFASEKAKNTARSKHFWKLRCRKVHAVVCREAHFQVKMIKTQGVWTTFGS